MGQGEYIQEVTSQLCLPSKSCVVVRVEGYVYLGHLSMPYKCACGSRILS